MFKYQVEFNQGCIIEFDFESELLDELFEIAKDNFNELTADHEDVRGAGYEYLQMLNWNLHWQENKEIYFKAKNITTDKSGFDALINSFNNSLGDCFTLEWREQENEDGRRNLLDLSEDEFVNDINPFFVDNFEFVFDDGHSKISTIAEYLLDSSMEEHVMRLIKDDDIELEKERSHYLYEWKTGIHNEENMQWFWFVLGEITQGFDSNNYKIYFV